MQRERLSNYKDMKPSNAIAWILLAMFGYWMVTSKGGFFQMLGSLFGLSGNGSNSGNQGSSAIFGSSQNVSPQVSTNVENVGSQLEGVHLPHEATFYKGKALAYFNELDKSFPDTHELSAILSYLTHTELKQIYFDYGIKNIKKWNGDLVAGTLYGHTKEFMPASYLKNVIISDLTMAGLTV